MKYRRLDLKELQSLEKEFIRFLASNHITAEDWQKLKKENKKKVDGLLDIFSDIVWERTLPTVQYLEFIGPTDCKTFFCAADHIQLMGMSVEQAAEIDLRTYQLVTDLPEITTQYASHIKFYHSKRQYQKERNQEIYTLINNGCLISKQGHLYQLLTAIAQQE